MRGNCFVHNKGAHLPNLQQHRIYFDNFYSLTQLERDLNNINYMKYIHLFIVYLMRHLPLGRMQSVSSGQPGKQAQLVVVGENGIYSSKAKHASEKSGASLCWIKATISSAHHYRCKKSPAIDCQEFEDRLQGRNLLVGQPCLQHSQISKIQKFSNKDVLIGFITFTE